MSLAADVSSWFHGASALSSKQLSGIGDLADVASEPCRPDVVTVALGVFSPVFERGLKEILGDDRTLKIVLTGLGLVELKQALALRMAEVMIIDEAVALEVLTYLSASDGTVGAVVLAGNPSAAYRKLTNACGACCLSSSASPAGLLSAVHLASGKQGPRESMEDVPTELGIQEAVRLTPREIDVLTYLSMDRSYPEVALALKIGVETVRSHASNIRLKLNVRTRRELVGMPVPGLIE